VKRSYTGDCLSCDRTEQLSDALTTLGATHILMDKSGSSSVVEHLLPKQRVASSILVSRSKLKKSS
jgi:hypothetical protein